MFNSPILIALIIGLCLIQTNVAMPDEPQCISCDHIQGKCVVTRVGMYCTNPADREALRRVGSSALRKPSVWNYCVPDEYQLFAHIYEYCCLWSPKIGCRQLAGKDFQKNDDLTESCDVCLSSCACERDTS
ncbi:hypothetical protein KR018_010926, partial [Drosophila ironensis]